PDELPAAPPRDMYFNKFFFSSHRDSNLRPSADGYEPYELLPTIRDSTPRCVFNKTLKLRGI
ncbi:MAG: hypothetical protein RI573_12545, partial [Balneolaceae bacterium]|nr:hypothetical protein [Balneolaceae bacterium]